MQGLDEKEYLRIAEEVISCLDIDEDSQEIMIQCAKEHWVNYYKDIIDNDYRDENDDIDENDFNGFIEELINNNHHLSQQIDNYIDMINIAFSGKSYLDQYCNSFYCQCVVHHITKFLTNLLVIIIEELRRREFHKEFNQYLEYNNYYDN